MALRTTRHSDMPNMLIKVPKGAFPSAARMIHQAFKDSLMAGYPHLQHLSPKSA